MAEGQLDDLSKQWLPKGAKETEQVASLVSEATLALTTNMERLFLSDAFLGTRLLVDVAFSGEHEVNTFAGRNLASTKQIKEKLYIRRSLLEHALRTGAPLSCQSVGSVPSLGKVFENIICCIEQRGILTRSYQPAVNKQIHTIAVLNHASKYS